ncbi:hypothetical protein SAMN04488244_102323 [Vibrio hangzhouensis]|uniref:Uncharacterized protein n=1 Tax=Vibrio hangzhouensis TaxID=462991 RepID=A0A1H5TMW4_9VIBR|nr:hypothetical protein SAMN04488244_102323 [Vibrio hangzhouensis]
MLQDGCSPIIQKLVLSGEIDNSVLTARSAIEALSDMPVSYFKSASKSFAVKVGLLSLRWGEGLWV